MMLTQMKTSWSNECWVYFPSLVFWLMILLTFSLTIPMETTSHLVAIWDVGSWGTSTSLSSWLVILLLSGLAPSRDFVIFLFLSSFWTWYLMLVGWSRCYSVNTLLCLVRPRYEQDCLVCCAFKGFISSWKIGNEFYVS
jgi:hypothetical protein